MIVVLEQIEDQTGTIVLLQLHQTISVQDLDYSIWLKRVRPSLKTSVLLIFVLGKYQAIRSVELLVVEIPETSHLRRDIERKKGDPTRTVPSGKNPNARGDISNRHHTARTVENGS